MNIEITNHAVARKNQRGFTSLAIEVIQQFGHEKDAPGNATKIFFGNRQYKQAEAELKKVIQLLNLAGEGALILTNDNTITIQKKAA